MCITIQLDLPEALAEQARVSGLLDPLSMKELIASEVRRREAALQLNAVLQDIRAQPGEPIGIVEVQEEIDTVRAEKRARETGRLYERPRLGFTLERSFRPLDFCLSHRSCPPVPLSAHASRVSRNNTAT